VGKSGAIPAQSRYGKPPAEEDKPECPLVIDHVPVPFARKGVIGLADSRRAAAAVLAHQPPPEEGGFFVASPG